MHTSVIEYYASLDQCTHQQYLAISHMIFEIIQHMHAVWFNLVGLYVCAL